MDTSVAYVQARQLRGGDVLVNVAGTDFTVVKIVRVGRGFRVHYTRADSGAGVFTAAPEAIVRVALPQTHAHLAESA